MLPIDINLIEKAGNHGIGVKRRHVRANQKKCAEYQTNLIVIHEFMSFHVF